MVSRTECLSDHTDSNVSVPTQQTKATKPIDFIQAFEDFWSYVERVERDVLENGYGGRLPPICFGDPWDEEFAAAYEAISPYLRKCRKERYFLVPVGLRFCPIPFKAETAAQALMFFLNPSSQLYGEHGVLDSAEYKAIKAAAMLEHQQRDVARIAKPQKLTSSRSAKTRSELIDLRGAILEHHFPKGKPFQKTTLTSDEIGALFGWSQPTVSRKMSKLFKGRLGMSGYAAVFGSHSEPKGYKKRLEDKTLTLEALWFDKKPEDTDFDEEDDEEGMGCLVLK